MAKQPHHGRGGSHHIGRLRIKAAKILTENLGFEIRPEEICPLTGSWRTDTRHDIYRWELFSHKNGVPFVAGCWSSLTDFVKQVSEKDGKCYVNSDREICSGMAKS